jgi:(p)ppGpp synthase/HD superfamily hydrolase
MKDQFKEIASEIHARTNHFYDKIQPYSLHLQMVVDWAEQYIHYIPEQDRADVYAACWLHDTIEDCRKTYNDIKEIAGEGVAEVVYALTNEKGRTRKDRGNDKYYQGINDCVHAPFIKVCDRLANMQYSKDSGSKMYQMYLKELDSFVSKINFSGIEEMKIALYNI